MIVCWCPEMAIGHGLRGMSRRTLKSFARRWLLTCWYLSSPSAYLERARGPSVAERTWQRRGHGPIKGTFQQKDRAASPAFMDWPFRRPVATDLMEIPGHPHHAPEMGQSKTVLVNGKGSKPRLSNLLINPLVRGSTIQCTPIAVSTESLLTLA